MGKIFYCICVFASLSTLVYADDSIRQVTPYYFIQENLPGGLVRLKIIEEDQTKRANQNTISQDLVFEQIFTRDQTNQIPAIESKYEASAHRRMAKGTDAEKPMLPTTGNPLWVPKQNFWTPADETAYSAWFATVSTSFDTGSGLVADCADMGLLFRWVYARNNYLPIANTLVGSGKLFGQFSSNSQWDALPTNADWTKDERFKAALAYLFNNTYTHSIIGDMYPTLVNPQYVRPGSMFMIIRPTDGHTQTISSISPTNGITTFWGNEPAAETIFSSPIILEGPPSTPTSTEQFVMWRDPQLVNGVWSLIPGTQMPGYSQEEYAQQATVDAFQLWFDDQLGISVNDDDRLSIDAESFQSLIASRITTTAEGLYPCFYNKCAVNSTNYNNYSTFMRDSRLVSMQATIQQLVTKLGPSDQAVINLEADYTNEAIFGSGITYLDLMQTPSYVAALQSDPTLSFELRWGIKNPSADPNLDFKVISQALFALIGVRDQQVENAYQLCANGCSTTSPSVVALNTSNLDLQIRYLYAQLTPYLQNAKVNAATFPAIQSFFEGANLMSDAPNSACADAGTECTYNDIAWSTGASDRMKIWSPNAYDSLDLRWGYPVPAIK